MKNESTAKRESGICEALILDLSLMLNWGCSNSNIVLMAKSVYDVPHSSPVLCYIQGWTIAKMTCKVTLWHCLSLIHVCQRRKEHVVKAFFLLISEKPVINQRKLFSLSFTNRKTRKSIVGFFLSVVTKQKNERLSKVAPVSLVYSIFLYSYRLHGISPASYQGKY